MLEGWKDRETVVYCQLDQELEPGEKVDAKPPPGVVRCPICRQDSNIGNDLRWVQLLTPDFVTINLQNANAMELFPLECESCKTKDKAVARCVDCANFLCLNCVQAHYFMRFFENHTVLGFDKIKNTDDTLLIHKPVNCLVHPSETMRYFCSTCQIPVCNECAMANHKPPNHKHEKFSTFLDEKVREQLMGFIKKGLEKVRCCDSANRELENSLKQLQKNVDDARHSIEDAASQSIEFINNCKVKFMEDLENLHLNCESRIMENLQTMNNTSEKINDACRVPVKITFMGNMLQLQNAICCNFGKFYGNYL
ncbi:unnamed protein product [Soboliphyme baturini]|uniref:B box-type domain-containing protein n=1 Tax=Soboliphyme baturini TaxID=241478 RepID=A0A183J3L8_9BILA|nr:unnamed protein product [Soboliphyme baturini]